MGAGAGRVGVGSSGPIRRRVVVSGRVQGVWYRDTCGELARQLGVAGWVRNLPDGRVEVVAEGGAAVVRRMIEWARAGPPHAVVTDVQVTIEEPAGEVGFTVRW